MVLTSKDYKILAVLDKDARLSDTAIAKSVGTSKQVVRYRLKRLEEEKVIENYYTMLDVGQLGFDSYYVFVQLTGLNSEKESSLYTKIIKLPQVTWLITGVGRWDAVILFCATSIEIFNQQLSHFKKELGAHLHELMFTSLIQAEHISYKFLDAKTYKPLKTTPKLKVNLKTHFLDEGDKKVLRTISQSARLPITEVADKTKLPVHTVHYKLKQLIKRHVIQGFRPKINVQKLGIQWYLLLIKFGAAPLIRTKTFIEFCKQNKQVYYVTNTVGTYDIMLDIHVKNSEEFRKFLFDMKDEFADLILLYESILVFEELVINYIPEIVLQEMF